ncbi:MULTISPECIES: phosphotransferase family protein [Protofrankia]|uniref:Aminoglycoside phosphotransferase n=1 Tax=Candidatus Protofrankia datiscae TaxID=2716812 RepID=F8B6I1_9ACTN|nr:MULTISPECIES: phosphotransferase [Protofrankia]AEH09279.1 aminoglycoside phosphotransferase [Candidatus Protofrankia datiscae]
MGERTDGGSADAGLVAALTAVGRRIVGEREPAAAVVLSARHDRLLVRYGDAVLKAHAPGTDPAQLALRLRLAADPRLSDSLLAPLPIPGADAPGLLTQARGRLVSAWPVGIPLYPEDPTAVPETAVDDLPWEQAAALLARLHAVPPRGPVPPARVRRGVERAMAKLSGLPASAGNDPAVGEVLAAYATLPPGETAGTHRGAGTGPGPGPGARPCSSHTHTARTTHTTRMTHYSTRVPPTPTAGGVLVHGDWHLGQLLRLDGQGLRIIDVDDLGAGDPVWDLARPAAWYAAGVLAPAAWGRFLRGYTAAGGRAVPPDADPWPVLDAPARALAVAYAANAVADSVLTGVPLDSVSRAFVDCCRRMRRL